MVDEPKTIFELTEGSAPALTDYALTGEDPAGNHVLRHTTWQSIRNLFLGAPTANNDFVVGTSSGTWQKKTLAETQGILRVQPVHKLRGLVSNPQAVYAQRPQIVLMRADAAITITRIHVHGSDTTPGAELAGDLKWADDVNTGGFANAAVIDVCDTTNGVKTITSGFDDPTVASGKYIYFQMDSSPNADWKDFYIEVFYTYD